MAWSIQNESQCNFLISLNNFLRVVSKCSPKNIRLIIEEDLWICEILYLPIVKFFNEFMLEQMPEMIVIDKDINNPMFMIRSIVLLRVYFPLGIALK